MDHIYTPIMDKVFVDRAILSATAINVTRTVVLHAQTASWDSFHSVIEYLSVTDKFSPIITNNINNILILS